MFWWKTSQAGASDGLCYLRGSSAALFSFAPLISGLSSPPEQFLPGCSLTRGRSGGPIDCVVNVGQSRPDDTRTFGTDVAGVDSMGGHYVFVTGMPWASIKTGRVRGSWSVVRREDNSNQIATIDQDCRPSP